MDHRLEKYRQHQHQNRLENYTQGGIAPNQVIARSEFKLIKSECDEGCDWCIYVTVVTCADTLTSTLCIQ